MINEEFEQLKSTVKQWLFHTGSLDPTDYANELKLKLIEPREKRIAELEKHIVDLKDYILQVSKFLHNNNNTRPDKLAYKERDVLLIKELKLFEKWELSK